MMPLGWLWPIFWQGQIWSPMLLYEKKVKTKAFSETIVVYDIKVDRCSQLKRVHEALWVPNVKVIHWPWSKSLGFEIFKLLFLNNRCFSISSALRWAIQDQWSSGFLIGSLSNFKVTKVGINSCMRKMFGLDWIKHPDITCTWAPKCFPIVLL